MSENRFYDVDYLSVKRRLKQFLAEKTMFKDYNFEGSAISMWLHFISYAIVYINSILNFFANEMFIDSAVIDENVLKHSHQQNYLPKRKYAATLPISISNTSELEITIPIGSKFMSGNLSLTNIEPLTIEAGATSNFVLYEGLYTTLTYTFVDRVNETIRLADKECVSQNYFELQVNGSLWTSVYEDQNFRGADVFYIRYLRNFDIRFDDVGLFNRPKADDIITVSYIKTNGAAYNGTAINGLLTIDVFESNSDLEITPLDILSAGEDEERFDSIKKRAPLNYATAGRIIIEKDYQFKIKESPVQHKFYDMTVYNSARDVVTRTHHIPVKAFTEVTHKKDVGFYVYTAIKRTKEQFEIFLNADITAEYTILKDDDNEHKSIVSYLDNYRHMQTFNKYKVPSVLHVYPHLRVKLLGGYNVDSFSFETDVFKYIENNFVGFNKDISKSLIIQYIKQFNFVDYVDVSLTGVITSFSPTYLIYLDSVVGYELYENVSNTAGTFTGKILEIWEEKQALVINRTSDAYAEPSNLIGDESATDHDVNLVYSKRVIRLQQPIKPNSLTGQIRDGVTFEDDGDGDILDGINIVGTVDYELGYITFDDDIINYSTDELVINFEFEDDIYVKVDKELFLDHKKAEVEYL